MAENNMAHLVKVDGIELGNARGHRLECDECGDIYTGGNHEDRGGPFRPNGYRGVDRQQIVEDAIHLGWTGLEKYQDPNHTKGKAAPDRCPICSAMKGAPYVPTVVHEPNGIAVVVYRPELPLVQKHTIVRPLGRAPFGVNTEGWPTRDRYSEPPAVLELKFTASESGMHSIFFESNVRWPERKRGDGFKEKAPKIRLWSWGDGKVYAKELLQQTR
jgi:hypothetical protein